MKHQKATSFDFSDSSKTKIKPECELLGAWGLDLNQLSWIMLVATKHYLVHMNLPSSSLVTEKQYTGHHSLNFLVNSSSSFFKFLGK